MMPRGSDERRAEARALGGAFGGLEGLQGQNHSYDSPYDGNH